MKRFLPFAIIAIVLCAAVVVGVVFFRQQQEQKVPHIDFTRPIPATPTAGADPPRAKGKLDASVTLEEFADFQCPPCSQLHPELSKLNSEYGSQVRFVFRHFPLTNIHKYAFDAAKAAEAAGLQGRFWEMHDWLFENQLVWSQAPDARSLFIEQARALELDLDRFVRDLEKEQIRQRIAQDFQRGTSLGIRGTPSVFINGQLIEDTSPQGLRSALNSALN